MSDSQNITAQPAYLLLTARVSDVGKMTTYARALDAAGLVAAHGGVALVDGQPINRVEGWPDGVGAVLIRFPSRTAAESFWFSAKYQDELKPLRRGAGTVQAAIFSSV